MKKLLIVLSVVLILIFNININVVLGVNENYNTDEIINDIISGINEEDFSEILSTINNYFGKDLSLKEWLIKFFSGELDIDFNSLKTYLLNGVFRVFNSVGGVLGVLIFLVVFQFVSNIIISKNNDNTEKNIIFYICYSLFIIVITKLATGVFSYTINIVNNVTKIINVIFPVMFSISGLVGNFGVALCKPITAFISIFSSSIITNFFIPILLLSLTAVLVGNISNNITLNNLNKNILNFFKWCLGILTVIFTCVVSISGLVNAQYNSASVKVLKYATGSLVPIVGGFLSGGVDVFLSSALLLKNSIGVIGVIYLFISIFGSAISILILSFLIKFFLSICEPIADKKFVNIIMSVTDIFNYLAGIIFICGFMCFLSIICFITSTISVI